MNSFARKRSSSTSLESIADGFPLSKKARADSVPVMGFSALTDEVMAGVPANEALDLSFGELTHDFESTPVPGNDMNTSAFDSFFSDHTFNLAVLSDSSDVSSDEEKPKLRAQQPELPSSSHIIESPSISPSDCGEKTEEGSSPAKNEYDSNEKRQADRAARNRESSRRAREKAKHRFRALENDNMALREMVRRFRIQNEHLLNQLDRANAIQQSCTMCRYNAAMAQQPGCPAPSHPVLRN